MRWNVSRSVARLRRRSVRLFLGVESFPAKFSRTGFRRNFGFDSVWRDRHYAIKQVEAFAVREGADWLVITVVTRYYSFQFAFKVRLTIQGQAQVLRTRSRSKARRGSPAFRVRTTPAMSENTRFGNSFSRSSSHRCAWGLSSGA